MRFEIEIPDELCRESFREKVKLNAHMSSHPESLVWGQLLHQLTPPTCSARWVHEPWRVEVECDLEPGHKGTHRARIEDGDGEARIRWNDPAGSKPDPGWVPHMVDQPGDPVDRRPPLEGVTNRHTGRTSYGRVTYRIDDDPTEPEPCPMGWVENGVTVCGGEVDWARLSTHRPFATVCRRCGHEREHLGPSDALEATQRACQQPTETDQDGRHGYPLTPHVVTPPDQTDGHDRS